MKRIIFLISILLSINAYSVQIPDLKGAYELVDINVVFSTGRVVNKSNTRFSGTMAITSNLTFQNAIINGTPVFVASTYTQSSNTMSFNNVGVPATNASYTWNGTYLTTMISNSSFTEIDTWKRVEDLSGDCENNPASCGITIKSLGGFTQSDMDGLYAKAQQNCKDDPSSCGNGGFTQSDMDNLYSKAKNDCKNDPSSCGITIQQGFTQADLDSNYDNAQQVCQTNPESCGVRSKETIVMQTTNLSPNMDFHLNQVKYNTTEGIKSLWVDFKLVPHESKILFEVADYGEALGNDQDEDGFTIEEGDCNDTNPKINPEAEEVMGDGIDQNCEISVDD